MRSILRSTYHIPHSTVHIVSYSAHALQIPNKITKKYAMVWREGCNNQSVKFGAATKTNRFVLQLICSLCQYEKSMSRLVCTIRKDLSVKTGIILKPVNWFATKIKRLVLYDTNIYWKAFWTNFRRYWILDEDIINV